MPNIRRQIQTSKKASPVALALVAVWLVLFALAPGAAAEGFGSIVGQVFVDLDGNRARSADEPGLANAELQLVVDGEVWSVLTNADGVYRFEQVPEGHYPLRLVTPRGYEQVQEIEVDQVVHRSTEEQGPEFPLRAAPGRNLVYNGSFEDGLVGWVGYGADLTWVNDSHNGPSAARVSRTCPTYVQSPVTERDPPSPRSPFGAIVGRVFLDRNGDQIKTDNEPGLASIVVQLSGDAGNAPNQETRTNANGTYRFESVPEGKYVLGIVVPAGFQQVNPGTRQIVVHRATVEDGPEFALQAPGGTTDCTSFNLDDSPDSISYPRQGETYIVWAWVKATSVEGRRMELRVREQGGATPPQESPSVLTLLDDDWQWLSVLHTVAQPDRTVLDLIVTQLGARSGDAFIVDDISIALGSTETAPAAPDDLRATPRRSSVRLEWDDVTGEGGYTVERRLGSTTVQVATLDHDTDSFLDEDLASGTRFSYRVRAFNSAGPSPYSREVTVVTPK